VSEKVNRKCPLETRFYNFYPTYTDPIPQTPHLLNNRCWCQNG